MAKSKLNQIIAVAKGKKGAAKSALETAYHVMAKPALFEGLERNYKKINDEDESLPPEISLVQKTVAQIVESVRDPWAEMFDVILTQDAGNCEAKADVVVDEKTVLTGVPVTTLIFLEKQLSDFQAFVDRMPTRSPSEEWTYNSSSGKYVSKETETHRTKKVNKPLVLLAPTEFHPGQAQVITEDVLVGYWKIQKISGAISEPEKQAMAAKVSQLKEAVVKAREEANSILVENQKQGEKVLDFIFGPSNQ